MKSKKAAGPNNTRSIVKQQMRPKRYAYNTLGHSDEKTKGEAKNGKRTTSRKSSILNSLREFNTKKDSHRGKVEQYKSTLRLTQGSLSMT
jgi:hypothetical protein